MHTQTQFNGEKKIANKYLFLQTCMHPEYFLYNSIPFYSDLLYSIPFYFFFKMMAIAHET